MDFSLLKNDEKIKAFANYTSPSPKKIDDKSNNNKNNVILNEGEFVRASAINLKENYVNNEDGKDKSNTYENKFMSYDPNKVIEKAKFVVKTNENLMGDKGFKINATDVIFKNEVDFTNQDICKICENNLSKTIPEKKNCTLCGFTICKTCSTRKVNENRVCDLCFLKVKSAASEIRRKEFLNVPLNRKEDLKNKIAIGKSQANAISGDIKNLTEKIVSNEISYATTIQNMQLNLSKLQQKQLEMYATMGISIKTFEKKKEVFKKLQEKTNKKQIFNDSILNNLNTKKQIYLSKFDEFCKMQTHKEDLENSDEYRTILKEQELFKTYKDKNKPSEYEESKNQKSSKYSSYDHNNSLIPHNTPSYDERKPSILFDNIVENSILTPQNIRRSFVGENASKSQISKRNEEEFFCENPCTGSFFTYHKQKPKFN